jgi:hypothetical protein
MRKMAACRWLRATTVLGASAKLRAASTAESPRQPPAHAFRRTRRDPPGYSEPAGNFCPGRQVCAATRVLRHTPERSRPERCRDRSPLRAGPPGSARFCEPPCSRAHAPLAADRSPPRVHGAGGLVHGDLDESRAGHVAGHAKVGNAGEVIEVGFGDRHLEVCCRVGAFLHDNGAIDAGVSKAAAASTPGIRFIPAGCVASSVTDVESAPASQLADRPSRPPTDGRSSGLVWRSEIGDARRRNRLE